MSRADLDDLRQLMGQAKRPRRDDAAVLDEARTIIETIAEAAAAARELLAMRGRVDSAEPATAADARQRRRDTYVRVIALIEAAAIEGAECR